MATTHYDPCRGNTAESEMRRPTQQLTKSGKGNEATAIPQGYKQTEVGMIPEDWEVKPLAGLTTILHGFGFQSKHFTTFGKYRLTTPGHFHEAGGFRDVGDKQKFYDGPLPNGYLLREGDLIVAMTEQADGLLGSAALVPSSGSYLHNQRLGKIRMLSPDLSTRFLYRIFNSPLYRAKVRETAAGTKVKHTSPTKLLEITVPLPPTKAEQEAIAEALSDVDKLLGSLEKFIAKKRAIKQAAMQQLLTGKTRLPGFSGDWETKRLENIIDCLDHVRVPLNETQRARMPGPYPYCGANGVLDYVNDFILDDDVVLIAEDGGYFDEYVRRPIAYRMSGKIWVNNHAHILRAKPEYSQGFLYFSLVHKNILPYLASGTRAKLNKSEMNKIEILLPLDNTEQKAIATILSDMDAEIAALERRRDKTRAIKQGMMQALLTGRIRLFSDREGNDRGL